MHSVIVKCNPKWILYVFWKLGEISYAVFDSLELALMVSHRALSNRMGDAEKAFVLTTVHGWRSYDSQRVD